MVIRSPAKSETEGFQYRRTRYAGTWNPGEKLQFKSVSLKYFVPDTVIVAESPVFVSWYK